MTPGPKGRGVIFDEPIFSHGISSDVLDWAVNVSRSCASHCAELRSCHSEWPGDLNGRVIDPETGLDAVRNVAIKDGKIVAISEFPLKVAVKVDASGHVVAPGFIDLHSHGQNIGDYRMQVVQGVTTALELESGILPVGDWYAAQATKKLPMNYGASAGWTFGRIATFTQTDPLATVATIFWMRKGAPTGSRTSPARINANVSCHWSSKA